MASLFTHYFSSMDRTITITLNPLYAALITFHLNLTCLGYFSSLFICASIKSSQLSSWSLFHHSDCVSLSTRVTALLFLFWVQISKCSSIVNLFGSEPLKSYFMKFGLLLLFCLQTTLNFLSYEFLEHNLWRNMFKMFVFFIWCLSKSPTSFFSRVKSWLFKSRRIRM